MEITVTYVGLNATGHDNPVAGDTVSFELNTEILNWTAAILPRRQFYERWSNVRSYQAMFGGGNGFVSCKYQYKK